MNTDFDKDFVVHNYSTTSTQPSQSLLYTAYELIRDTHPGSLDWVNVPVVGAPLIKINHGQTKKVVQYPPFLENLHENQWDEQEFRTQTDVDDWGAPVVEQIDVFSLEDLEEFQSTDLSFLFNDRSGQIVLNVHSKSISQQLPPLEEGPLFALIPQPHVHPSSYPDFNGPLKLIPYTKTKPIMIPPRTDLFSPLPYSRSAWLVPIRGRPPWERCTAALMLNSAYDASHLDGKNREEIIWTPMSVQSFWAFLLAIKSSGSAGAVGLSFHAARNAPNHTVSPAIPGYTDTPRVEPASHTINPRALLSALDYIKIYHEGPNAMHLRNMLHLWSYTEPQLLKKIRVLKGAMLALIDERSTGILLS